MVNKSRITKVKRISGNLNELRNRISKKNNMNFIEADNLIVDMVNKSAEKRQRKIVENIRRELEF